MLDGINLQGVKTMLETLIIILLVLWLLGLIAGPASLGGWIHLLLLVALAVFVIRLVSGRRAV
jgi:hypothetical protein